MHSQVELGNEEEDYSGAALGSISPWIKPLVPVDIAYGAYQTFGKD